ncbi:MAG TPA: POTRA domain-containing protein [Silvibacterium sp.]|nr:POTRA domain-containing protein [Silvibacterium sp.]
MVSSLILGHRCRAALFFAAALSFALAAATLAGAQAKPQIPPPSVTPVNPEPPASTTPGSATDSLRAWEGLMVEGVDFEGVDRIRLEPLPATLPLQPGRPLNSDDVRQSLRLLYSTGLYRGIEVEGTRHNGRVTIIFKGTQALFFGRISVEGLRNDLLASQLQRATRLNPGTRFSDLRLSRAEPAMTEALQQNGFYAGTITKTTKVDNEDAQVDVQFHVVSGPRARIGDVKVGGDPGMTTDTFRRKGRLRHGSRVNRETVSRALTNLRRHYQKQQRLEASVGLDSKEFQPDTNFLDYAFQANQGPIVTIHVNGVNLSQGKVRTLVPVFEEGTVDQDLLNEGDRRIRDYYQRQGYFDVQVTHQITQESAEKTTIVYSVNLGERHRVEAVTVTGNKYFSKDILESRLEVLKASLFDRHGIFSQALMQAAVNNITALYLSNGFIDVKVTPEVTRSPSPGNGRPAGLSVNYHIIEGVQQRIGKYQIVGNKQIPLEQLTPLLNLQTGEPVSPATVVADRDAILTHYLQHGFGQASIVIDQQREPADASNVDVTFTITEGDQTFVNRILISGLHFTRPSTIEPRILLHPGEPLNESALLDMQRQMYDLALFTEVNAAVQNPAGDAQRKNVLLQFTEAKRWDLSYGVGFQVQTGNPTNNCPNPIPGEPVPANCSSNGRTGASALVQFDVSRINLAGRNQSLTLRTAYGTLEQLATLIYSRPHIFSNPKLDFSLSGGYKNAQDITTYAASRLEGTVQITHRPNRPNTLIYLYTYRRVVVDPNSVQVSPDQIPLVSEPVRVGGPGFSWIRDTRRPIPLDAQNGTYTSLDEFFTYSGFSSEANFNRLDITNASYHAFDSDRYVLARITRFGYMRSFGADQFRYIPLPERLYAGGAQSLRGFSINAAGPRDSLTGFPIGGAGAFVNNTELRLPSRRLPYVGDALGFVFFHDMGNVFNNSSDIWPSLLRTKQPHSYTCKILDAEQQSMVTRSSSTNATGLCDFNNFSHAVGLGLRYRTPVGPLRFDFSYNLNPPIFPVIVTYGTTNGQPTPPHVGQAGHFNFFFSIGQAF